MSLPLAPAVIIEDPDRLAALNRTGLLDSPPDPAFDRLAELVQRTLRTPIALVSLVDASRQFFVSAPGFCVSPWAEQRETPLTHSFCQWVVAHDAPLQIEEAVGHPLVGENLAIRDLGVRAYLGIPFHDAHGHVLGSLCALDSQPRSWSEEDRALLTEFAALVETEIRLRQTADDALGRALAAQQAEDRLRDSEARFRAVAECLGEGLIITDLQDTIQYVNAALCEMTGYAAEEMIGATAYKLLFPPDEWGTVQERTRRRMDGVTDLYEVPVLRKGGERVWFEIHASPFRKATGEIIGTLSAHVDVTARREADARLQALTAELRRSNESLQEFASVASHDLQEPVRKIQTFGNRLRRGSGDSLSPENRDYLDRMLGAAERMQTLISDLLDYSRVTTKVGKATTVDLGKIAGEVITDLEARIQQTGGRVEVEDLPILEADPLQMRQLLQNLIGNALKFHRPGVPPLVRVTAWVQPDETTVPPGLVCRLSVSDNGIGFDARYAEKVFEVFERLNGRSDYEGNGVGLAICRRIAERHGGSIGAEGVPGEGATFTVSLPMNRRSVAKEVTHDDNR